MLPPPLTRSISIDPLHRHLAPRTGRRAAVHHVAAGPQEVVLVVDLQQLEGAPAAVALDAGRPHVRVVQLPHQPPLTRGTFTFEAVRRRLFREAHCGVQVSFVREK